MPYWRVICRGGSAFEVWQFTDRKPKAPGFVVQLGDLGIFTTRIKAHEVQERLEIFRGRGLDILGRPAEDPAGNAHFFIKDPLGLIFQIVSGESWFTRGSHPTGGACGL